MANQTIRISLKAYDHSLIDKSTEKIVKTSLEENINMISDSVKFLLALERDIILPAP